MREYIHIDGTCIDLKDEEEAMTYFTATCCSCEGLKGNPFNIFLTSVNDCMRGLKTLPDEMFRLNLVVKLEAFQDDDLFGVSYLQKMLSDLEKKTITSEYMLQIDLNGEEDWPTLRKKLISLLSNIPLPQVKNENCIKITVNGERLCGFNESEYEYEDKVYLAALQKAKTPRTIGEALLETV